MEDIELRDELIRLFLGDVPGQISALRLAVQIGDPKQWTEAAHRLKGGSGNLGAERFSETCFRAESAGRSGNRAAFDELLNEIESELNELTAAFESLQTSETQA